MRNYVIIAGAGISMDAPSNLPSWRQYNQELIEAIKREALKLCPEAENLLKLISLGDTFPIQSLSDIIVNQGAGKSYFPLLGLLNSSSPNANHLALSEMAKQGILKAVVTTNFDTLIETAFQQMVVPLTVVIQDEMYYKVPSISTCCLMKIHGSAYDYNSLIDTVTQKSKGLSKAKRLVLNGLFSQSEIIFIGFSGTDLDFDIDYIPIAEALNAGNHVTWIIQPGTALNHNVRKLEKIYSNSFNVIESKLSDFFRSLGVNLDDINSLLPIQNYKDETVKIRQQIQNLFSEPHIGAHGCIGLCITLLRTIGENKAAMELASIYESKLNPNALDILSVTGLLSLGLQKLHNGETKQAKFWISAEIECLNKLFDTNKNLLQLEKEDKRISEQMLRKEFVSNMAVSYSNLGNICLFDGNADEAIEYFKSAQKYAKMYNNLSILSVIYFNLARARYEKYHDIDKYLLELNNSAEYARNSGRLETLAEILEADCKERLKIGEYFLAQEKLNELEEKLKNISSYEISMEFLRLRAELFLRKGEIEQSIEYMKRLVSKIEEKNIKKWANFILFQLCTMYDHSIILDNLIDRLCVICEKESTSIKNNIKMEFIKKDIKKLPVYITKTLQENVERKNIIYLEYFKKKGKISENFASLCLNYIKTKNWYRLMDVAKCCYYAADTDKEKSVALYYMGCAEAETGEYSTATEYFNEVIQLGNSAVPLYLGWSYIELSKLFITKGDKVQAEQYYRIANNVIRKFQSDEIISQVCMAYVMKLIELEYWNDAKNYIIELKTSLEEKEAASIQSILEFVIRQEQNKHCSEENNLMIEEPESIATKALYLFEQKKDREQAWQLINQAKAKYEELENQIGVGKCENNIANFYMKEGNIKEAFIHFEKALKIKKNIGDIGGVIAQISNIISLLVEENVGKYVNYAEAHLPEYQKYNEKYLLYFSLFRYYLLNQKYAEALHYATLSIKGIEYVNTISGNKEAKKLAVDFIREMHQYFEHENNVNISMDIFNEHLLKAKRLYEMKKLDESINLLETLKSEVGGDVIKLSQIEGTMGNAYLSDKQYQKAINCFRETICLLLNLNSEKHDLIQQYKHTAINGLAIALDYLGQSDESILLLKKTLSDNDIKNRERVLLTINYCNRLINTTSNMNINPETFRELLDILNALNGISDLNHNERGTVYHTYGIIYFSILDYEKAKSYFIQAKNEFIICNSPYLKNTEQMLKQIEEIKKDLT